MLACHSNSSAAHSHIRAHTARQGCQPAITALSASSTLALAPGQALAVRDLHRLVQESGTRGTPPERGRVGKHAVLDHVLQQMPSVIVLSDAAERLAPVFVSAHTNSGGSSYVDRHRQPICAAQN
eukprot:TRINITY_DN2091_c0_g7_i1.p1 TRINITY_DN2091_c0_g7~~TRINITY_DN2091_c0_g7_i1.p1  ORF type:complete len:125 (-),score=22.71 TRINITY_DN2091_c0_g7_i1:152-526(-)